MAPLVIDMIHRWRADLLAGEATTTRRMAQSWLGVERALQGQMDALAYEMSARHVATVYQLRRMERYRTLMSQTRVEMDKYSRWLDDVIRDRQLAAATSAVSHAAQAIQAQQAEIPGTAIRAGFDRLPVSAVEAMAGNTANGSPVRDVLRDASRLGPEALAQELITGLALGRNPLETARRAMRNGLGRSFTRMALIARTETLRVYRDATLESYRASGVVTGYRRVAAKSERTCLGCLLSDGRYYELTVPFEEHPNGRCVMIPEIQGKPATTWQTGKEWLESQPEDAQRRMLGPSRFRLWKNGDVSLDELVQTHRDPVWGNSLYGTNVGSLLDTVANRPTPVTPPTNETGYSMAAKETRTRVENLANEYTEKSVDLLERSSRARHDLDRFRDELQEWKHDRASAVSMNDRVEVERIDAEIKRLNKLVRDTDRLVSDLAGERLSLEAEKKKALQALIRVDDPIAFKMKIDTSVKLPSNFSKFAWEDGAFNFQYLVSKKVEIKLPEPLFRPETKNSRSWFRAAMFDTQPGTVNLTSTAYSDTIIHELGHWLEMQPGMIEKTLAFYDRRTQGETLQPMGIGYGADEETRKDKFINPYIGKTYGRTNTEVLSMGLELLWKSTDQFAIEDPDMFDFIYDLVRGFI